MGKYSHYASFPIIQNVKNEAIYSDRWQFNHPFILERLGRAIPQCRICGKREQEIANFTNLIAVYDRSTKSVEYECTRHGGKDGKILWDCFIGEEIYIPPEPYQIVKVAIDIYQSVAVKIIILCRFVRIYFRGLFFYLITRNDTIAELYRKFVLGRR